MTTVSPFARSSAFEDALLSAREQTVSHCTLPPIGATHQCCVTSVLQIEEMYSVPESFLEIEVRNPQTHGAPSFPRMNDCPALKPARKQDSEERCLPTTR